MKSAPLSLFLLSTLILGVAATGAPPARAAAQAPTSAGGPAASGGGAGAGGGGNVIEGTAKATEGDTLLVNGSEVRLYGIDAPDPGQTCENRRGASYDCFAQATKELQAVVGDKKVHCVTKESPVKQRQLAVCTVEGRDVAAIMVRAGWALAYTALSPLYSRIQARAMSHRSGMWGGRVEAPWLWRNRQAALAARSVGKPAKKPPGSP